MLKLLAICVSLALFFPCVVRAEDTGVDTNIKRTIVFAMDSINSLSFKYAIDNGYCPNIKWLIDHGAYFENGVSVLPSVSLTSDFSIVTGAYPGKHGILGWMWYNESEGKYYSIDGSKIWDPVENRKMVEAKNWMSDETETLFEAVEKGDNAYTSALGTYATKGADRSVFESLPIRILVSLYGLISDSDMTADSEVWEGPSQSSLDTLVKEGGKIEIYTPKTSEIETYFRLHILKKLLFEDGVDSILFLNMFLDVIKSKRYDSSLIYLWVSGTDNAGHLVGGRSKAILHSYQLVDTKVGAIMSLVKLLGMGDETLFVVAGNHGIKGWNEHMFERTGYRDMLDIYAPIIDSGIEFIPGNRGLYFPNATEEEIGILADEIIKAQFVDFTMYRNGGRIFVNGKNGTGVIDVKKFGDKISESTYTYEVTKGRDPLSEGDMLAHSPFRGLQPEELNENGPAPVQYPLAIERILGLFVSDNVPDMVVTIGAKASGQHGDLGYEDSVVPMVFSGPGIKRVRSEEPASILDIAPTIANAMGVSEPKGCDGNSLDIFGSEEEYSLPWIPAIDYPLYLPFPEIELAFLFGLRFSPLFFYFDLDRIVSIAEIMAMLPDPPLHLGTYDVNVFRTFIL